MGRWAQAERTGRGRDEWAAYGAVPDTFEWGATITLWWTLTLTPDSWFWWLEQDTGGWAFLDAGSVSGSAEHKTTVQVPVPGRAYRFRIAPQLHGMNGPWSAWMNGIAP